MGLQENMEKGPPQVSSINKEDRCMKKALLAFNLEPSHLGKDVFLFPYYICKRYNYSLDIATCSLPTNRDLPLQYRGTNIIRIEGSEEKDVEAKLSRFIKEHAVEYDFLVLFHLDRHTVARSCIFKKKNPKGIVYVKLDMNIDIPFDPDNLNTLKKIIKYPYLLIVQFLFFRYCDIYSVETQAVYDKLCDIWSRKHSDFSRFELIPNGFDEQELERSGLRVKPYSEKSNVMITVGRLGSPPKNTEFLLRVIERLNLKDWKVRLIGPYTSDVRRQYDEICVRNEQFAEAVGLVGNVPDRQRLFSYYNDAKIFLLPSHFESFGLVLVEAMRFGNYIITSPVTSADDLTNHSQIGCIVPLDEDLWAKKIQKLIDNGVSESLYQQTMSLSEQKFRMKEIIDSARIFRCLE